MSDMFQALSDPTRRKILNLLKDRDMTAGEITEHFSISKPSISHHLGILKNAGLVENEKKGQNIIYSFNATVFQELVEWVYDFKKKGEKNEDQHEGIFTDR
jgi:ArsR family transcriptional regulator